jgi:serine/threonine protein kinase
LLDVRDLENLDEEIERRAALAVGTVLDRKWRLDRLLGCGGMGAVYAATHRNGTRAAVKLLHPEAALSPILRRRFLREGYVANKVEHPGAVSILDDDVDEAGNAYLVMELLHGETLDARLTRAGGSLPAAQVIQIICPVLDCLESAHGRGIVHRDIKPGNLFLTTDGAVKVLDFGIARLTETRGRRGDTTGVQALGTPDFMPPEQARGHWEKVDGQSDLFALGAVMQFALTGKKLREAPTTNEQLLAAMVEPPPPLASLLPDVNELVANLVDRALAFRKEDRWPNAAAFRQAARAAYGSIADQPIERAPKLSVRPIPNGPVSLVPEGEEEPSFDAPSAVMSSRAVAVSSRARDRTKLVGSKRRWPVMRTAVVATTAVVALMVFNFRGSGGTPHPLESGLVQAAAPTPGLSPASAKPPPSHGQEPPQGVVAALGPIALPELERPPPVKATPREMEGPRPSAHAPKRRRGHASAENLTEIETPIASPSASTPSAVSPASSPTNEGHAVDLFSRRR